MKDTEVLVDRNILLEAFYYELRTKSYTPMIIYDNVRNNVHNLSLYELQLMWKEIVYTERRQAETDEKLFADESCKKIWIEFRDYLCKEIEKRENEASKDKGK